MIGGKATRDGASTWERAAERGSLRFPFFNLTASCNRRSTCRFWRVHLFPTLRGLMFDLFLLLSADLNRDLAACQFGWRGDHDLKHPELVAGFDPLAFDAFGQSHRALESAVPDLAHLEIKIALLTSPHARCPNGERIASNRNIDVLRIDTR